MFLLLGYLQGFWPFALHKFGPAVTTSFNGPVCPGKGEPSTEFSAPLFLLIVYAETLDELLSPL